MSPSSPLETARVAALIARLDPRDDEPCRVAGCIHPIADADRAEPLAA